MGRRRLRLGRRGRAPHVLLRLVGHRPGAPRADVHQPGDPRRRAAPHRHGARHLHLGPDRRLVPAERLGIITLNAPASRIASMFSSGTRRSASTRWGVLRQLRAQGRDPLDESVDRLRRRLGHGHGCHPLVFPCHGEDNRLTRMSSPDVPRRRTPLSTFAVLGPPARHVKAILEIAPDARLRSTAPTVTRRRRTPCGWPCSPQVSCSSSRRSTGSGWFMLTPIGRWPGAGWTPTSVGCGFRRRLRRPPCLQGTPSAPSARRE